MAYAVKSGVQHSAGAEMKAHDDQPAATRTNFFFKFREKPSKELCECHKES